MARVRITPSGGRGMGLRAGVSDFGRSISGSWAPDSLAWGLAVVAIEEGAIGSRQPVEERFFMAGSIAATIGVSLFGLELRLRRKRTWEVRRGGVPVARGTWNVESSKLLLKATHGSFPAGYRRDAMGVVVARVGKDVLRFAIAASELPAVAFRRTTRRGTEWARAR